LAETNERAGGRLCGERRWDTHNIRVEGHGRRRLCDVADANLGNQALKGAAVANAVGRALTSSHSRRRRSTYRAPSDIGRRVQQIRRASGWIQQCPIETQNTRSVPVGGRIACISDGHVIPEVCRHGVGTAGWKMLGGAERTAIGSVNEIEVNLGRGRRRVFILKSKLPTAGANTVVPAKYFPFARACGTIEYVALRVNQGFKGEGARGGIAEICRVHILRAGRHGVGCRVAGVSVIGQDVKSFDDAWRDGDIRQEDVGKRWAAGGIAEVCQNDGAVRYDVGLRSTGQRIVHVPQMHCVGIHRIRDVQSGMAGQRRQETGDNDADGKKMVSTRAE